MEVGGGFPVTLFTAHFLEKKKGTVHKVQYILINARSIY